MATEHARATETATARFALRRGVLQVCLMLVDVPVLLAVIWAVGGLPTWLFIAAAFAYLALEPIAGEFWFSRLSYIAVDNEWLVASLHPWGLTFPFFMLGLLIWPSRNRFEIRLRSIVSVELLRGAVKIDYWGPDSGAGPIVHEKSLRLRPVSPVALRDEIMRRVPSPAQRSANAP